ncbi:DUF4179 domain-containing protein [Sporosarcina sp. FSL K6-3457]|uniref:DUF4179 domain-containing protein n=1 Tax=Sporosarcina sp. FSL K6-3457 TaxID=2978204 RepID=UPI0030FB2869
MNNNQWPDLKKEMDRIEVPTELSAIITNTVNENRAKKSKKKVAFYFLSAAILGFGLFIGSASISPAMAKIASTIPIIGTFFNDSMDEGLKIAGKKGLTQVVGQSSKDNGITITIDEVFYDGTRFTIGYTQESLFAIGEIERPTIEVDGKEINFASGYSGDFITPQKYKGTINITPTEELPIAFDMNIRIDAIGVIPGNWAFDFPVKQSNEVTVVEPRLVKTIEGIDVEIRSLKLGPAGTDLTVRTVRDEGDVELDPFFLDFYVIDDAGNVLDMVGGSGSGDTENGKEIVEQKFLYSPLKEGSKKVRVVPYIIPVSEKGWEAVTVPLDEQTVPFVVDQGEFGRIVVTKVVHQQDKIVMYYDLQTDEIIDNVLSRNALGLEDAEGNSLWSKDGVLAERIEGKSYKQEFETSGKNGLQIKTYKFPKTIMYEEFNIDIPN